MSLFEGTAPPNIETTKSLTATAPKYLTDYLTELARTGTSQLGSVDPVTGQVTPAAGKDLVAGMVLWRQQLIKTHRQPLPGTKPPWIKL